MTRAATPAQHGHRIRVLDPAERRPARCNLNPRQGCANEPYYVADWEQRTRPSKGRPRIAPMIRHPCRECGDQFAVRFSIEPDEPEAPEAQAAA